jgi:hypothetical protein
VNAAAVALGVVAAYAILMAISNVAARAIVREAVTRATGGEPVHIMAAPVPFTPLRRWVVAEADSVYLVGDLNWLRRPRFTLEERAIERFPNHFAVAAATRGPAVRRFLSWARFPYYVVEERDDGFLVRLGDARYTLRPAGSWAAVEVEVGRVQ